MTEQQTISIIATQEELDQIEVLTIATDPADLPESGVTEEPIESGAEIDLTSEAAG